MIIARGEYMVHAEQLAKELNWPQEKIKRTIELLDEGIPFPLLLVIVKR